MKLSIKQGATSQLALIFIQDSSSTTGAGLTGLVFNTSGLTCYRGRSDDGNAGGTAISLATATLGTWATGGFKEKDATNMPGVYEIGITNASLAAGSRYCVLYFKGATNMAPCVLEIELTGWDNQDAVHGGMSALPNTAVTTNASLLTSGTGTDQLSVSGGKVLLQATQSGGFTFSGGVTFTNSGGDGFTCSSSGSNGNGITVSSNGSGDAMKLTGGATGRGVHALGGATSGAGIRAEGSAGNANGMEMVKNGSGQDLLATYVAANFDTTAINAFSLNALKYDWNGITGEASFSTLNALRKVRNKIDTTTNAGSLTVFKEDSATQAYTQVIIVSAVAELITSVG